MTRGARSAFAADPVRAGSGTLVGGVLAAGMSQLQALVAIHSRKFRTFRAGIGWVW